jgi:hypothetical protein
MAALLDSICEDGERATRVCDGGRRRRDRRCRHFGFLRPRVFGNFMRVCDVLAAPKRVACDTAGLPARYS